MPVSTGFAALGALNAAATQVWPGGIGKAEFSLGPGNLVGTVTLEIAPDGVTFRALSGKKESDQSAASTLTTGDGLVADVNAPAGAIVRARVSAYTSGSSEGRLTTASA